MKLELVKSRHGQSAIELTDAPITVMRAIRTAVSDNWLDSPAYQASRSGHPFLQGYDEKYQWILVEFWGRDPQPFLDYLNSLPEIKNVERIK